MKKIGLEFFVLALSAVLMFGVTDTAEAQKRRKYQKFRKSSKKSSTFRGRGFRFGSFKPHPFFGANLIAANYFGDLAPLSKAASTDISLTRPGLGLHSGYKIHSVVALRAGLNWYRVFGDDFNSDPEDARSYTRYVRNLSFRNDIKEFQLGAEFYMLPNDPIFNTYLFFGGALILHEPMGKVPDADYQRDPTGTTPAPRAGEWVKLRPLGTEGQNLGLTEPYKSMIFSIPVSLGASLKLPGTNWSVSAEFGLRFLFTDYIDDVSGTYASLDQFTDDLSRIMSDRSTEPMSSRGEIRDLTNFNIQSTASGYHYEVNNGTGHSGAVRGNPEKNDMLVVFQLAARYSFSKAIKKGPKRGRRPTKFR